MQKRAPLKRNLGNGRTSLSGFQTPKWIALSLAALLGLTATTVQGRLAVVNGDFGDLTGLTPGSYGWYSGLPKGWTGSDGAYAINSKNGATPPTCNPSQLGRLRQPVGTLEKTADVVLTFDVSDVFNGETVLKASLLDGAQNQLASGEFSDGDKQTLVAKRVPAGTAIVILFQATQSTPGLDNVSVAVREPGSTALDAAKPRAVSDPITVAAYYYPGTHPDPRWDKNKYPGFTEWDEIKAAKPRFTGHIQHNPPVWGYQNEAKPEVMAQKIAAAADYGVNAFIFDWYYYNDGPYLDDALDEGFLHATNNARMKFALMWANHDWYDIQGYNPADNNLKLLYPGKVTPATWDKICDLVIARYFKHPSYWRVDGKPYFSIYEMSQFLDSFGSIENARAALDQFRAKVHAAGFPGLHVNAIVWGEPNLPGGKTPPGWPKLCRDLALDSLTSYTWVHHGALNNDTFPVSDYVWGRRKYLSFWARAKTDYPIPYFPNAMVNWDNSPRAAAAADWSRPAGPVVNPVVTGNTPAAFKRSLEIIRQRLLAAPTQPKIITINAWNEWPEGSCLEPMQQYGYGYLEAIKAVFVDAGGDNLADHPKILSEMEDTYVSLTDQLGPWIWAEKTFDNQTCQLWNTFEIPTAASITKARLVMTADNEFTLYLDGRELGRGNEWRELYSFDLTQLLTPGRHVLAVKCFNSAEDAGMLFGLRIDLADGRVIEVKSDQSWRIVPDGVSRWENRTEAKPGWPAATIIAPLGGTAPSSGNSWMQAPGKVILMPLLLPIRVFFWQTGWFQITLLSVCGLVILISLRLVAQLALHHNERLLLLKERARIAREIHDDIGARMTQLVLDGEEAQSELSDCPQPRLQLTHICEEARGLLATMDEILWAVNPRRDTLRDFTTYVCKYAQTFLKPTKIQCLLEVEPAISTTTFSMPLRHSLLMAIKEALNNAVKYSEASELRLKIQWQNQRLVVVVEDNGKGFDPATVRPDRNGLTNMAQRMSEVGGCCLVTSQPGHGCRVEFSIPLKRRHHWAWIWDADQFSEQINEAGNNPANELSQNHDPTKF
jgi:signal transduction histidine kinase